VKKNPLRSVMPKVGFEVRKTKPKIKQQRPREKHNPEGEEGDRRGGIAWRTLHLPPKQSKFGIGPIFEDGAFGKKKKLHQGPGRSPT